MHKLSTWCKDHRNFTLTGTFSGTDRVSNFLARVKSPFSTPAQWPIRGALGPSLFLDHNEARRAEKKFFGDPTLSKGLDDPPPPPPPLSQSLDPALPPSTLDPLPCVMPLHEEAFLLCGCPSQGLARRVSNRPTDAHFWRKYKENSPNLL